MNKYVVVAVVSLGITILSLTVTGVLALLNETASVLSVAILLVMAAVMLVGFIERFRLAWQWGRILGGAFSWSYLDLIGGGDACRGER